MTGAAPRGVGVSPMPTAPPSRARRAIAEGVGTAFLVAAVVGSGIMGERLSGGNAAIALLANSLATGAALVALIVAFGPVSGAHLNPVVTLAEAFRGALPWADAAGYWPAQVTGAVAGVAAAHLMFGETLFAASSRARAGPSQVFAEFVATAGLVLVIRGSSTARPYPLAVAVAAGGYIAGAYWFTASTSFANPAVTIARTLTASFSGIRPADAPAFVAAQLAGGAAAAGLARFLFGREARDGRRRADLSSGP